jgi:ABC-2 type transport system ATP-binding protein
VIDIQNLAFSYGRSALYEQFNLRIDHPGVYGMFGRNGSGKSTLLKLMAGLLFRKTGALKLLNFDPAKRHPDFLEQIYIVPEEFHLPNLSLDRLAQVHAPFYPKFNRNILDHAVKIFEIRADVNFEEMSLGQKKKAAMAFALATCTPILLLDEPTNGLDIVGRDQFKQLMLMPEQQQRITLISTHQAHDLERIMNHIIFIDQGRLALSAPMHELANRLRMGVAANQEALNEVQGLIYREAMGDQFAYVSARSPQQATTAVHMELLYKALCINKEQVLDAMNASKEVAHV